jgi:hypothetical protein
MADQRSESFRPSSQQGWSQLKWGGPSPVFGRPPGESMNHSFLQRLLGGPPLAVLLRLIVVSLIVGVMLMWLDINPSDILFGIERFFRHVWSLGFGAIGQAADYILAGAAIVVPIWLVLRLMSMRGTR